MKQSPEEKLEQKLRDSGSRLEAVQALAEIDSYDSKLVDQLVSPLVHVVETESNAYTRLGALTELERMSSVAPEPAATGLETVASVLGESIRGFDGRDPSENQKISRLTQIVAQILDGTSPEAGSLKIGYEDIGPLINNGNAHQRSLAYSLLGRTATPEAIRILLGDFSHEVDSVQGSRERALETAESLVTSSVAGGSALDDLTAAGAFGELWGGGQIQPTDDQVDFIRRTVLRSIESSDPDGLGIPRLRLEQLTKVSEEIAESCVSMSVDSILSTDSPDGVYWEVLLVCAGSAPEKVLECSEELGRLVDDGEAGDVLDSLGVVESAASEVTSVPAVLANPVLDATESEDTKIARKAAETAGKMGFYPVPDRLEKLTRRGHPSLSRVASRARERLVDGQSTSELVRKYRHEAEGVGIFDDDAGEMRLKLKTDRGYWVDPNLGELREEIVERSIECFGEGSHATVTYPFYEPSDAVLVSLGLVLEQPSADAQIGLYSPGSRSQWGTKSEVRGKLDEFGLATTSGEVISAVPIPEVVPHSYVSDGEVKDHSDGSGPGRIVLTKNITELEDISNLDAAVLNMTARVGQEVHGRVQELRSSSESPKILDLYSYYSRLERDGRPQYRPPLKSTGTERLPEEGAIRRATDVPGDDRELAESRLVASSALEAFEHDDWLTGSDDVVGFSSQKEIEIDELEAKRLSGFFDSIFQESASLFDSDASSAGGLIFARQMFFERLPVPPGEFDDWIRTRYEAGERFLPPMIGERIADVDREADTVESLEAVKPLNSASNILERIRGELEESNPLYRRLKRHVVEAVESGETIAVFSSSPKNAQLIRDVLRRREIVPEDVLESDSVSVVSPNLARKMGRKDKLIVCGSLHPEHAGFYIHPKVKETIVITYDRGWASMIRRHTCDYVDRVNQTVGDDAFNPYSEPELTGDLPEDFQRDVDADASDEQKTVDTVSSDTKGDTVAEAMDVASETTYETQVGREERELRRYEINASGGEVFSLANRDRVLKRRVRAGEDRVQWINPDALEEGDTIVRIPEELETKLWREHIRSKYEDEVEAESAIDRINIWRNRLSQIRNQVNTLVFADEDLTERERFSRIGEWVRREAEDFERVDATIKSWFVSVQKAENSMDLVENPSLRIGPRSAHDITAIGTAFGDQKLVEEASEIHQAMRGLRNINRSEGSEFRDSILEMFNSPDDNRVTTRASVDEITELADITQRDESVSK